MMVKCQLELIDGRFIILMYFFSKSLLKVKQLIDPPNFYSSALRDLWEEMQ